MATQAQQTRTEPAWLRVMLVVVAVCGAIGTALDTVRRAMTNMCYRTKTPCSV